MLTTEKIAFIRAKARVETRTANVGGGRFPFVPKRGAPSNNQKFYELKREDKTVDTERAVAAFTAVKIANLYVYHTHTYTHVRVSALSGC